MGEIASYHERTNFPIFSWGTNFLIFLGGLLFFDLCLAFAFCLPLVIVSVVDFLLQFCGVFKDYTLLGLHD